ncbi:MAG: hypothetical protein ACREXR_00595 [Gammaproteobacteria bacterium]
MYIYHETEHAYSHIMGEHTGSKQGYDASRKSVSMNGITRDDMHMVYGILRGCGDVIEYCDFNAIPYLYIDHSFFWSKKGPPTARDSGHYYRIISNGRHFNDMDVPDNRFKVLGITVKPWQLGGDKIVVVPISKSVATFIGTTVESWLQRTLTALKRYTNRKIIVQPKNPPGVFYPESPFIEIIRDAHAVVVAESNVAVDAIVEGIPVFCSPQCAAAPVGLTNLSQIESPVYSDRTNWLNALAYQQFTLEEIRNGTARSVTEKYAAPV